MGDIITALQHTPAPTILIAGGILFLFVAVGGRLGANVTTDQVQQGYAAGIGILLLFIGIALHLIPVAPPSPITPTEVVIRSTAVLPTNTPTDTPVPPTNTPTNTPTATPTDTPVPPTNTPANTPTATNTRTPMPFSLGEFRRNGEPSQMNFQKFVGGYMIGYQGITYALCSGDDKNLRGKWVSDNIEWKEGDPVYPEIDGCPIIKEGELGPRYGFGKYWCKLGLSFRACLEAPMDIGGEEQKPKVKIYSNGLSFEVTDYHSVFELTYDGQTDGTWQRLE